MGTGLNIRPLARGDETEWRRLWTRYLEYYESTVTKQVYQKTFARLLSSAENEFHGLIAELDGRPTNLSQICGGRNNEQISRNRPSAENVG